MQWPGITPAGFPHSEINGSKLVSSSPSLIAGNRVLHRLFAPRHPPYALCNLTKSLFLSRNTQTSDATLVLKAVHAHSLHYEIVNELRVSADFSTSRRVSTAAHKTKWYSIQTIKVKRYSCKFFKELNPDFAQKRKTSAFHILQRSVLSKYRYFAVLETNIITTWVSVSLKTK